MGDVRTDSLFKHCIRLTNYFNPYDEVLSLSNMKRLELAPRVGRVGLPDESPNKAVDINCGDYYKDVSAGLDVKLGVKSHAWYFYGHAFMEDLVYTLNGALDRAVIPTRELRGNDLFLVRNKNGVI